MSGGRRASADSPPAYEFIVDHSKDTPDTRPSWLADVYRAHARWVFGDDNSMVTGSKDPLHTVHILGRAFQTGQPAKYRALKMNVGEKIECAGGKFRRGLNLDSPLNMDRLDPTMHAMLDATRGHVCWSPLPVGWMELADDVERTQGDRLSLSKTRSGYVSAFHVLTFDDMSFSAHIHDVDGPFRPSSGPVQTSTGADDANAAEDMSARATTSATEEGGERTTTSPLELSPRLQAASPDLTTPAADAGGERAAFPSAESALQRQSVSTDPAASATDEDGEPAASVSTEPTASATDEDTERPASSTPGLSPAQSQATTPTQRLRRHRSVTFLGLCVTYVFYSTVHPVIALYAIMLKFQERLDEYDTWPSYMTTVYDYLEPRLRHLFVDPTKEASGSKLLASEAPAGRPRKKIDGRLTQTAPEGGSPPRTRSRVKALTVAQNQAKEAMSRRTRSQTARAAQLLAGAPPRSNAPVKTKKLAPAEKQARTRSQGSGAAGPSRLPAPGPVQSKEKAAGAQPKDDKETDQPAAHKRKVRTLRL